jgi:hypothetical protein
MYAVLHFRMGVAERTETPYANARRTRAVPRYFLRDEQMQVKRVKRKDGTVGFLLGNYIHSDKRMAEIALSSAMAEARKQRIIRQRTVAPIVPIEVQNLKGVTRIPNTIVDGVEFTPDEVRQVRRLKAALFSDPEKFVRVRSFLINSKKVLGPLDIEITQESMTKLIAQCL